MLLEIVCHDEGTPVDLLDGTVTVGGGPRDDIHIEGLPHRLLTLELEGPRVTVTSVRSVRIGAALFPANVPRVVVEGEEMKLPNDVVLRRPADPQREQRRRATDTALVARELLAGLVFAPALTRAATLTCVTGADVGRSFPLAFDENVLGRAEEVNLRLRDRSVSRRHARLLRRGSRFLVEDLHTTNGVYLNGLRVRAVSVLQTGDVLELGRIVLRYEGPEAAPGELTVVAPDHRPAQRTPLASLPAAVADGETPTIPLPPRPWTLDWVMIGLGLILVATGAVIAMMMLRGSAP